VEPIPLAEGHFAAVVEPSGVISKMARSVLRRIRVASKDELKAGILAYFDDINREPVVHTWTYKIDTAA
jgi:hypothetical protein